MIIQAYRFMPGRSVAITTTGTQTDVANSRDAARGTFGPELRLTRTNKPSKPLSFRAGRSCARSEPARRNLLFYIHEFAPVFCQIAPKRVVRTNQGDLSFPRSGFDFSLPRDGIVDVSKTCK